MIALRFRRIPAVTTRVISARNMSSIQYLETHSGERIAYEHVAGDPHQPTILYVPGYGSGKDGDKAVFMKSVCTELGYSYIRYDPVGIGQSAGKSAEDIEFQDWFESGREILTKFGSKKKNILVGSSMGGWISLLLATQPSTKHQVSGLVLIAPALNFYKKFYADLVAGYPKDVLEKLNRGEIHYHTDQYGTRPIRKSFAEKTGEFELHGELDVEVPVHLLHGVQDEIIPYQNSIEIMNNLKTKDVELTFVKDSAHRFQAPGDLSILQASVEKMMKKIEKNYVTS